MDNTIRGSRTAITLVLIILVLNTGPSDSCDSQGLRTCVIRYITDITTRMLESLTSVCKGESSLKKNLDLCISSYTKDCRPEVRTAMGKQIDSVHHTLFVQILNRMICRPTRECDIRKVMECYNDVFETTGITIPRDKSKTSSFLDGLITSLYKDDTYSKYCSAVQRIDYGSKEQCVTSRYKTLFTGCIGAHNQAVTKEQSEVLFMNAMGQLADADLMRSADQSFCSKACYNFGSRYNEVKSCLKVYVRFVIEDLVSQEEVTNEDNCRYLREAASCVSDSIRGCTALANIFRGNRGVREQLENCDIEIGAAWRPNSDNFVVLLLILIHIFCCLLL